MATAQITQALDDVGPQTGPVYFGGYTNDTAPLIRVSLGDPALVGATVQLSDGGQALGAPVTVTSAQAAQGFVDIPVTGLAEGWNILTASVQPSDGSAAVVTPYFALGLATAPPPTPTILGATDDAGANVGTLSDGARTDDATPTLRIAEAGLPPIPQGSPGHAPYGGPPQLSGHLQLFENGVQVGDAVIGFGGEVTITTSSLSPGEHALTAVAVDRAGNVSAASAPFHLLIGPDAVPAPGPSTAPAPPPPPAEPTNGADDLTASAANPVIWAGQGDDTLRGGDANDSLYAGQGDDLVIGGTAANEVNGNQGQDTLVGRSRVGDFLMGGQGDDLIDLTASAAHNRANGNLGDDLIRGGSGGDTLWGGQGDDVIVGGAGADWISGDRGENTVTGGAGADVFHALAPGHTRVTDFNVAEGDRVQVDLGQAYEVRQVGADTVVDLGHGGQLLLEGVRAGSLSPGWIFQA
jgi:Ca2+-binding RTX toxin-like protein